MIYGHGNEQHLYPKLIADFSSNVWYKANAKNLRIGQKLPLNVIRNYPEPDSKTLKQLIAKSHQLTHKNVLVTNGATEAIYLIAHAFFRRTSYILYPSFSEYHSSCKINLHTIKMTNQNTGWSKKYPHNSLLWCANPNNPDGKVVSVETIKNLLNQNPKSILVLDESYVDLSFSAKSAIQLLYSLKNLIIIRSFTKTHAIPGIRLGYLLSSPLLIQKIAKYAMPWNVNAYAQALGALFLTQNSNSKIDKSMLYKKTLTLQNCLNSLNFLTVYPSDCNYFLVKLHQGTATQLKEYLIQNHSILIRDATNFIGLNASHFRVAIQKPSQNQLLVQGIQKWHSVFQN